MTIGDEPDPHPAGQSWAPEVDELQRRLERARAMGGPENVARQPEAGRLTAIEARLNALRSPFRTADAFGVEEIVDPRDTRPLLTDWVGLADELEATRLGPKSRGMRP